MLFHSFPRVYQGIHTTLHWIIHLEYNVYDNSMYICAEQKEENASKKRKLEEKQEFHKRLQKVTKKMRASDEKELEEARETYSGMYPYIELYIYRHVYT